MNVTGFLLFLVFLNLIGLVIAFAAGYLVVRIYVYIFGLLGNDKYDERYNDDY